MISVMTRFGTMALVAGILLSGAMPASAAHLACKYATVGLGRAPSFEMAMDKAVQNWRMHASLAYGNSYSSWYNALNPGRHCDRKGGLTHCRVWANPCR